MSLLISGPTGNIAEVDPTWKAIRTTMRPLDHGAGGYFRVAMQTGALTGVGGGGVVWAFHWTSATYNAIVWYFKLVWLCTTAFGAAQLVDHGLYQARAWTGDYTGGATATLTGNNNKKRTSHATSLVADFRLSTTAALGGSPSISVDAQPIIYRQRWCSAIGQVLTTPQWVDFEMEQEHPIVLAQNEGLVLQNVTAMGASGVLKLGIEVAWAEVPIASF